MTPRELEILALLATGRTDREIAAALFVSPRTIEGHVAHIFAKLGVRTRTAAASAARDAGLVASVSLTCSS
jgi:DNA-binding NarL/FixJ family response regulator